MDGEVSLLASRHGLGRLDSNRGQFLDSGSRSETIVPGRDYELDVAT